MPFCELRILSQAFYGILINSHNIYAIEILFVRGSMNVVFQSCGRQNEVAKIFI